MTFSTDIGWINIQELEPRVARLQAIALKAMALGDPHDHGPHMLYSDMKPYLAALLGGGRGQTSVRARHDALQEHEAEFADVIAAPWVGTDGNDAYLHNQWLFDVACNYVLDELTGVYDSLYGSAA